MAEKVLNHWSQEDAFKEILRGKIDVNGDHNSCWCHDTQHNDIQHNDIQHNNRSNETLSTMTFSIMAECCYAEFRYAECRL